MRADSIDGFPQPPRDPDIDAPISWVLHRPRGVMEVRERHIRRPGFLEQDAALTGQFDAVPVANEQGHTELPFKLADVPAQWRLGDVQA